MHAAPLRLIGAALWPLSVWTSLSRFDDHPADDYVERTSPILATAIGFWICALALIAMTFAGGVVVEGGEEIVRMVRRAPGVAISALAVITPVLYIIGFWLYTAREERFRG